MSEPDEGAIDYLALAVKSSPRVREWLQEQRDSAHAAGHRAGEIAAVDDVIRAIQERLATTGPYDDTRPYTDVLVYLADKRRGLTQ